MSLRELPLLFAVFLDLVGFGMAFPDIQLRAEKFGAPGLLIGALLSSYFAVQLIASPKWGSLSDRIGRKPVLLVCTALSALSMLVYGFADNVWFILASRVLAGLAAANVVVGQAYIADITPERGRVAAMGRVSAAILGGLVAGPAIGGELAAIGGNRLLGFTSSGFSALSFIWILFGVRAIPPSEKRKPGSRGILDLSLLFEVPALSRIVVVASAGWFVLACLEGTFGRLIEHLFGYGQREFGWIFSYESLLGAFTGLAVAWLSKRMKPVSILRAGYVMQSIGLGLTPLAGVIAATALGPLAAAITSAMGALHIAGSASGPFLALLLLSSLYAFGAGIANPVVNSVCSSLTPEFRQGELFGLLQAARSVGFLIGPGLGGWLFDWHAEAPYFLAGGVALLAALIIWVPENQLEDSQSKASE